jgi:hypothetical protein
VTRLRRHLAAFSTIAAIVAMSAAPLAQALHTTCLLPHHDCGTTAKISKCCCDDRSAGRSESTPVQERVDVRADGRTLAVLPHVMLAPAPGPAWTVHTSPPRLCPIQVM